MAKLTHVDRWEAHAAWAWLVRTVTVLVPVLCGVTTIAVLSRVVPRPGGAAVIGWFALVFGGSWGALWLVQRLMTRLLPLAVLLEMSLIFPERAPSRLRVARRAGSASELTRMAKDPLTDRADETTQQAAERILTLVAALARHDKRTRGHAERVRSYTDVIAERMGLAQADRDRLRWAALLHDIGKLEVPAALLNKPGKPTSREWEVLRAHPAAGAKIAAPLMDWLGSWGEVIVQHHEKFDGTGYPAGLSGHGIGQGARIVAVADTFEVMTAARSYKRPVRKDLALKELVRCAGTQFDPAVVRALVEVPSRRLMLVMGPSAWIAGVPFLGQAPVALAGPIGVQSAAAAFTVATAVGVGSVAGPAAPPAPVSMTASAQVTNEQSAVQVVPKKRTDLLLHASVGTNPLDRNDVLSGPSTVPTRTPSTTSPSSHAVGSGSSSSSAAAVAPVVAPSPSAASASSRAVGPAATSGPEHDAALTQSTATPTAPTPTPAPPRPTPPPPPTTRPTPPPPRPTPPPVVHPTPSPDVHRAKAPKPPKSPPKRDVHIVLPTNLASLPVVKPLVNPFAVKPFVVTPPPPPPAAGKGKGKASKSRGFFGSRSNRGHIR